MQLSQCLPWKGWNTALATFTLDFTNTAGNSFGNFWKDTFIHPQSAHTLTDKSKRRRHAGRTLNFLMSVCLIVCKCSFSSSKTQHACTNANVYDCFTMQSLLWPNAPINGGWAVLFTAWKYIFFWQFRTLLKHMPVFLMSAHPLPTLHQSGSCQGWSFACAVSLCFASYGAEVDCYAHWTLQGIVHQILSISGTELILSPKYIG